jgi:hypothetical protein
MPQVTTPSFNSGDALARLVRAGLATALIDGVFAIVLTVFVFDSTFSRLWQGVAAVLVGNSAFDRGARTTALGLFMHCFVAFTWSAVFVFVVMRSARIRRVLGSRFGALKVAAVYGPAIWLVMSLLVIPMLLQRPPVISTRWWLQFVGHFPFVGLPIVTFGSGSERGSGRDLEPVPGGI